MIRKGRMEESRMGRRYDGEIGLGKVGWKKVGWGEDMMEKYDKVR